MDIQEALNIVYDLAQCELEQNGFAYSQKHFKECEEAVKLAHDFLVNILPDLLESDYLEDKN